MYAGMSLQSVLFFYDFFFSSFPFFLSMCVFFLALYALVSRFDACACVKHHRYLPLFFIIFSLSTGLTFLFHYVFVDKSLPPPLLFAVHSTLLWNFLNGGLNLFSLYSFTRLLFRSLIAFIRSLSSIFSNPQPCNHLAFVSLTSLLTPLPIRSLTKKKKSSRSLPLLCLASTRNETIKFGNL